MKSLDADRLLEALRVVQQTVPAARLSPVATGNLAVVAQDDSGIWLYWGFIDWTSGHAELFTAPWPMPGAQTDK